MSDTVGATAMAWLRADARRFDLAAAVIVIVIGLGLGLGLSYGTSDDFDNGWADVVAGVGAFLVLAVRSRWPCALFGINALSLAAFVIVYQRPTLLMFSGLVLLSTVCVRLERWPAVGLGVVSAAGLYATALRIISSFRLQHSRQGGSLCSGPAARKRDHAR